MGLPLPSRPWQFEDGDAEVEIRLSLPEGLSQSDAARLLRVDAKSKSVAVLFKDGRAPLMPETELYETIRPSEVAWYCDKGCVVVSLPKQHAQKWPALTDDEALEKRFGPIRTPAMQNEGESTAAAAAADAGPTGPSTTGEAGAGSAPPPAGAAQAWSSKARVEALLRAAQGGDVAALRRAADALLKAEQEEADSARDAPGKSAEKSSEAAESSAGASGAQEGAAALQEAVGSVKDGNGRTALHFAAQKGRLDACRYLVQEVGVASDPRDDAGETPLMLAAREDHVDVVQFLLDHGADPTAAASKSAAQALHYAAGHGALGVVKLLLGLKTSDGHAAVDVNAGSEAGPPLLWACGHGKVEVVEELLGRGADPNLANVDGVTPLLTAAAAGETPIVATLTKAGADVNEKGARGATPLFIAASEGNVEMLCTLLEGGANPSRPDEDGMTAVQVAGTLGLRDVVQLLLPVTQRPPSVPQDAWTEEALLKAASEDSSTAQEQAQGPQQQSIAPRSTKPGANAKASPQVDAAKQRADQLFKAGVFQEALDAYTQAIDLLPKDFVPADTDSRGPPPAPQDTPPSALEELAGALFSNRSLCWMRLGHPSRALTDARAARKLRPNWGKACYREGSALQLLGLYEEAANAFFEGVQVEPGNVDLAKAFQVAIKLGKEAHARATAQQDAKKEGDGEGTPAGS